MTPNPKTGLVDVLDVSTDPPTPVKMWPVDAKEAFQRGKLEDSDQPRFVLAESYKPPEPAPPPAPEPAPEPAPPPAPEPAPEPAPPTKPGRP